MKKLFNKILAVFAMILMVLSVLSCTEAVYSPNAVSGDEFTLETAERSAEQGNSYAQCALAFMFYHGDYRELDYEKAFYWFKKSAERGYDFAEYNLGIMYYNGEGTAQQGLRI